MLAAQNDFERRKLDIINNEQELVALELEQAQAEADALKAMDDVILLPPPLIPPMQIYHS